jgi:DNA repair protein RecO (recombination protein O)
VIVSTRGVVVNTFNYRETSKIVEVFTESDGIVALIAKGIRKQLKLIGILEPLNIIFVSFYKKKEQELHLLSKVETISSGHKILQSEKKLFVGLTIMSLIKETQGPEISNKYLFSLTEKCIEALKDNKINPFVVLTFFVVKLTQDLGYDIIEKFGKWKNQSFNYLFFDKTSGELKKEINKDYQPKISRNTIELLYLLNNIDFDSLTKIQIVSLNIIELLTFIEAYLSYYLEKNIKIRTIEIFKNAL